MANNDKEMNLNNQTDATSMVFVGDPDEERVAGMILDPLPTDVSSLRKNVLQAQDSFERVLFMLKNSLGTTKRAQSVLEKNTEATTKRLLNSFAKIDANNYTRMVYENPQQAREMIAKQTAALISFLNVTRTCLNKVITADVEEYVKDRDFVKEEDLKKDYVKEENEGKTSKAKLVDNNKNLIKDYYSGVNDYLATANAYLNETSSLTSDEYIAGYATWLSEVNSAIRNQLMQEEQQEEKSAAAVGFFAGLKRRIPAIVSGVLVVGAVVGAGVIGNVVGKNSVDLSNDPEYLELVEEHKDALAEIQKLIEDNQALKAEYEEFKAHASESELANQEIIAEWQERFNDAVSERNDLQDEFDDLLNEYNTLYENYQNALNNNNDALVESLQEQLNSQSVRIGNLQNMLNQKDRELAESIADYNELEELYNELKQELEDHECEYPSELIESLKKERDEAVARAEDAERRAAQAEADKEASEQEKLQAQKEAEEAKAEAERLRAELENANNTIKELSDKLTELQNGNNYTGEVSNEGANQSGGASQVTDGDKTNTGSDQEKDDSGHIGGTVDRDPHPEDDYTRE